MKLAVTVDRDEDGVWMVECPSIPGCVSPGTTKQQALKNIKEAIALCLEAGAERDSFHAGIRKVESIKRNLKDMPALKLPIKILLFVGAGFACLGFSFVITWIAWAFQIEDKAFHCTDFGFGGFWCDIDTHRAAGDTIFPGWTWEKLKMVRLVYETVFYVISPLPYF